MENFIQFILHYLFFFENPWRMFLSYLREKNKLLFKMKGVGIFFNLWKLRILQLIKFLSLPLLLASLEINLWPTSSETESFNKHFFSR